MRSYSKYTSVAGVLFICVALFFPDVDAQTVVRRARLGNNTEDITFVEHGPLARHIVMIDGIELWAFTAQGGGKAKARKLFDLSGMDMNWEPRGITWVASSTLFALNDLTDLLMVDHRGRVLDRTPFVFPAGYEPEHLEGLAYLSHDSSFYPDHLILVAMGGDPYTRLEILRSDGVVVHEIIVDDELQWTYLGAVCPVGPDRILVSDYERFFFLDFDGEITAGPYPILEGESIEGAVQLANGKIATGGYWQGRIFMLDEYLNRLPEKDRDYKIGFDLVRRAFSIAWDATNEVFVALNSIGRNAISISPHFNFVHEIANPANDGNDWSRDIAVLPNEDLLAFAHRFLGISAIILYDLSGSFQEEIPLSWLGRLSVIDFMPNSNEFLVKIVDPGFESRLIVLGRDGAFQREIDFTPAGIVNIQDFAFFDSDHPSGGRLLIVEDDERVHIADLDGNLLGEFNLKAEFGILGGRLTAITTGPDSGAFAAIWGDNSELVVFTLP